MKNFVTAAAFVLATVSVLLVPAFASAGDPSGIWLVKQEDGDRRAHVKVSRCGQTLCNEIIWLSKTKDKKGRPLTDLRNKNPQLRDRPILGLTVLIGMREHKDGKWYGRVYSPERGKVYKGHIAVAANKLKVTGCQKVAFVPVCKTRTWTRVSP